MGEFQGLLGIVKGDADSEVIRQGYAENDDDWYVDDIDDGYDPTMDWD